MVYNRPEAENAALDGVSALAYMDQLLPKVGGLAAVSLPILDASRMPTGPSRTDAQASCLEEGRM